MTCDLQAAWALHLLELELLKSEHMRLQNEYRLLLENGTHTELCTKALEVIRARERINTKIDWMNCDITCTAVCLIVPVFCLDSLLLVHEFEANVIAKGLYAEHVPEIYKRCGAIVQEEPNHEVIAEAPFAVLDADQELAFTGRANAAAADPVAKVMNIDNISDLHVIEEIEHGLLRGSVAIVLKRAVADRRLPEMLLEKTGTSVCWDVFRTEARRVPENVVDSSIALRIVGEGKFVFSNNDWMTVLGGFLRRDVFVLGTIHKAEQGAPDRDFILNGYRDGTLCRVYYMKAPRGALRVHEFFKEHLFVDIMPLPQAQFCDIHGVA